MKKIVLILISVVICMCLLVGCDREIGTTVTAIEVNGTLITEANVLKDSEFPTDLTIVAVFADGTKSDAIAVTADMVTGFQTSEVGRKTAKVSYQEIEYDINYRVYGSEIELKFYDGLGTESNPYIITTAAELKNINIAMQNCFFELKNDIDLSDTEWTPLGTIESKFEGAFNGAGNTIKGMTISEYSENGVGMFGVTSNATVKNLKLQDISISALQSENVAAIVGNAFNDLTIDNCEVTGSIEGKNVVGGLAGFIQGENAIGGVTINNCTNNGEIKTNGNAGGLIGTTAEKSYVILKNSVNSGKVSSDGGVAGGLASAFDGEIIDCINKGKVIGNTAVGAVAKAGVQSEIIIIKNFVNEGELEGTNTAHLFGSINSKAIIEDINSTYDGDLIINWGESSEITFKGTVTFNGDIYLASTSKTAETIILADNASVTITGDITSNGVDGVDTITLGAEAKLKTKSNNFYLTESDEAGQAKQSTVYGWKAHVAGNQEGGWIHGLKQTVTAIEVNGTLITETNVLKDSEFPTDLTLVAVYADGTKSDAIAVTADMVTGFQTSEVGRKTAKVSYQEIEYDINYRVYGSEIELKFYDGFGTQDKPYIITTADELKNINSAMQKCFFELKNDIDLSDTEWTPLGTTFNKFEGTFNGAGNTIKGMKISKYSASGVGMFGITNNATIKNLKLQDINISALTSSSVGAIVGNAYSKLTIDNCAVTGSIEGKKNVGGLVGYAEGSSASVLGTVSITNCINKASIKAVEGNSGGIIAVNNNLEQLTVKDCENAGSITGAGSATGGIMGYLNTKNGNILIENCVNSGNINFEAANVGGIIGYTTNENAVGGVIINNCTNNGEIKTNGNAGGLIGTTAGKSYVILKNSVNSGSITAGGAAGGLASAFDGEIIDCTNKGKVIGSTAVGAVAKAGVQNRSITIKNFVNEGELEGTKMAYLFGSISNRAIIEDINSTYDGNLIINWEASEITFKGTVSFNGNIYLALASRTIETIILADNASVTITGDITSNGADGVDTITLGAEAKLKTKSNNFYLADSDEAGQAQQSTVYGWKAKVAGNQENGWIHGWKQVVA